MTRKRSERNCIRVVKNRLQKDIRKSFWSLFYFNFIPDDIFLAVCESCPLGS